MLLSGTNKKTEENWEIVLLLVDRSYGFKIPSFTQSLLWVTIRKYVTILWLGEITDDAESIVEHLVEHWIYFHGGNNCEYLEMFVRVNMRLRNFWEWKWLLLFVRGHQRKLRYQRKIGTQKNLNVLVITQSAKRKPSCDKEIAYTLTYSSDTFCSLHY